MRALERAVERVASLFAALGAVLMVVIAFAVTYEAISRYALGRPTRWVSDLTEYSMFFVTLLAAAWVLRQDQHVRVELLVAVLRPALRRWVLFAASLVGALTCAAFALLGLEATLTALARSQDIIRGMTVPRGLVLAAVPVGMTLLAAQFLLQARRYLAGDRRLIEGPRPEDVAGTRLF